jgi:hypothetical protein
MELLRQIHMIKRRGMFAAAAGLGRLPAMPAKNSLRRTGILAEDGVVFSCCRRNTRCDGGKRTTGQDRGKDEQQGKLTKSALVVWMSRSGLPRNYD